MPSKVNMTRLFGAFPQREQCGLRLPFSSTFAAAILALALFVVPSSLFAYGEIYSLRAPEEIPEGDDVGIVVTATVKESTLDRAIVIEVPSSWKVKRAYAVLAGGSDIIQIASSREIASFYTAAAGQAIVAFADNTRDVDESVRGIAYFVVFSTQPTSAASASVRAALVERVDPDSPPEIDKKTKRPKPIDSRWRMVSPFKQEFSFAEVSGKKWAQTVRLLKGWRIGRALLLEGAKHAEATLTTQPEALKKFFSGPFSIECWIKMLDPEEPMLSFQAAGKPRLLLTTNLLGQLMVTAPGRSTPFVETRGIFTDGIWHHIAFSVDSNRTIRFYVDAQHYATGELDQNAVSGIDGLTIGNADRSVNLWIDELHLITRAFTNVSDFESMIVTAPRDTMESAFALFHFNDFGRIAHSSVGVTLPVQTGDRPAILPILILLDSNAKIVESTSPVLPDRVVLSADMVGPSKVNVSWKTTSELGVKGYVLEQRIGNVGGYDKALSIEARHGMKGAKKGSSIIYRNTYVASQELPILQGDVQIYYRVAVLGYQDSVRYSVPVQIDYGSNRDLFVEQNQPNPFNPSTEIAFRLLKPNFVTLAIYDIIGREVSVLVSAKLEAGRHVYQLDATNWPGGIYFYKVKTSGATVTRKMVLAK